jgi:hypothetical protein
MRKLMIAAAFLSVPCAADAQSLVSGLFAGGTADLPQYSSPATGATVSIADGTTLLVVDNSSLLATLTVNLPPNPIDGQRAVIASGAGVTLLTISGNGRTIKGALAALSANGWVRYAYSATANAGAGAWFRTG